jgi:hypothetical protein
MAQRLVRMATTASQQTALSSPDTDAEVICLSVSGDQSDFGMPGTAHHETVVGQVRAV